MLRDRAKHVLLLTDCLSFAIVCNNDFNVPYDNLIDRHFNVINTDLLSYAYTFQGEITHPEF